MLVPFILWACIILLTYGFSILLLRGSIKPVSYGRRKEGLLTGQQQQFKQYLCRKLPTLAMPCCSRSRISWLHSACTSCPPAWCTPP